MNLIKIFSEIKQQKLFGRYITNKHIEPILETFSNDFEVSTIGYSVNKKPIYAVEIGTGSRKIFMWSQMHGNESTTTKALFDLFSFLKQDSEQANKIKKSLPYCVFLF
ncbi:hypothetical protein FPS14_contig00015-0053 [Flavobacterium psychrophilum]|nr:hypothetical protein FPS14_contig00015-0053 [Flavobacterium psychrophilum]